MNAGALGSVARTPELLQRMLFTFGMLVVYRMGCAIPTPGINVAELRTFFEEGGGGVLQIFNLFSGGAFEQLSIFALGIKPYVSSSVIPHLEELKKEGEEGRRTITRYTRYGTVVLALVQSFLMATAIEAGAFGQNTVTEPGWGFRLMAMITLTAGTAFIMWLGEQITERGIGNGISLVIFAGIVTAIPGAIARVFELVQTDALPPIGLVALGAIMIGVIAVIVYFERAQRRVPIQYARRVVGRQVVGGALAYFPLKLNTSGVIPPIFASSLLLVPSQIGAYTNQGGLSDFVSDYLTFQSIPYNFLYVGLIVFFCYFYTGVLLSPDDLADNIRKNGGYIPGIRPGQRTAQYISHVLNRITLIGAIYLSAVCVLPVIMAVIFNVPFYYGGTALLIVVGVAMDTMGQIEAHLVSRNYETFMRGKGRLGR
jgi:preprotein translocase subunit SecY